MKKYFFFCLLLVVIPSIIVLNNNEKMINNIIKYGYYSNKIIKVKISKTGEIKHIPLEEYVFGVVAGEMPASFEMEALKAQAVCARTYALKKQENNNKEYDVDDTTNYQVYQNNEELKNKWKSNYDNNYNKIKNAVKKTKGEVILYNNKLIDALFFSTSSGNTENSKDVFSSDLPYLKSVSSPWDEKESPVFKSQKIVSKDEFLYNLGLNKNSNIIINNIVETENGYVKQLTINDKVFLGSQIKKIFKLRSQYFEININDNSIKFDVKGFGHNVGMSQYGANGMAKDGKKYNEIITYYYQNSQIKKIY